MHHLTKRNIVAESNHNSATGLQAIALHEQELINSIDEAGREAERIVAQARADADALSAQKQRELDEEAARLRRVAAEERERERQIVVAEAEKRIVQVREAAASKVPSAVEELVALVVPRQASGDHK
jgi:vacuolar-type H+-ATPase subunit H